VSRFALSKKELKAMSLHKMYLITQKLPYLQANLTVAVLLMIAPFLLDTRQ